MVGGAPTFTYVAAAGTTVLVMGGAGDPLSTPPDTIQYVHEYTGAAVNNFVSPSSTATHPTGIPAAPYNVVAVITPEEDAPQTGTLSLQESVAKGLQDLDTCINSSACVYNGSIGSLAPSPSDTFVVFGYSQSAAIAMLEKAKLAAEYAPGEGPDVSFVVISTSRPNGGLVSRDVDGVLTYLLFGVKRSELILDPVPTDTQYSTVDIATQYDGFSDFPLNPLNLVAVLNAYMGVLQLHLSYTDHDLSEPGVIDQGRYGDTTYYMISTPVLPLLMPLQTLGPAGAVLADALDPALRVIVEAAYDRTVSPGVPTPFNVLYFPDPVKTAVSFLTAIPTGLDNAFQDVVGTRPFGTQRPEPYGIGGPDVEYLDDGPDSVAASDTSPPSLAASTASGLGQFRARTPSTLPARAPRPTAATSPTGSKSTGSAKSVGSTNPSKPPHSGLGSSKRAR
jgi:hypothetical protein